MNACDDTSQTVKPNHLLTKKDVAKILKVALITVNRLLDKNKIEYIRVGGVIRVSNEALEDYLESRTVRKNPNEGEK